MHAITHVCGASAASNHGTCMRAPTTPGMIRTQSIANFLPHSQLDVQAGKSVIVVGAGPAGLSAALHLQANGVKTTVLEGRARAGGRVHTVRDALSGPVDFGAQLCTGMSPDVERQAVPDPTALIARQLGVELAELSSSAPLFDGAHW